MIILVVTVTGLGVDARYDLTSFNIKPHFDLSLIPFLQSFDVPSGHASRFTHRWEFLFFRCKMRPVEEELRWGTGNCHPPRVVISGYSGCVSKLRPWEIFTNFTTLSQTCIYTESPSPKSWHIHVNRGQCHGLSLLDLLLCEFAKGCWITTTTLLASHGCQDFSWDGICQAIFSKCRETHARYASMSRDMREFSQYQLNG